MKNSYILIFMALALSGCFLTASWFSVEQTTIGVSGKTKIAVLASIDRQLELRGFKGRPGFDEDQIDESQKHFWYRGDHDTYAAIDIESPECLRFVTLVETGSEDDSFAKSVFSEISITLENDAKLFAKIGDTCTGAP